MNILKSMVYSITGSLFKRRKSATTRSRSYTCQCGKPVFFRNSACLSCGAQLGYDPELTTLIALEEGAPPDSLVRHGDTGGKLYQRCANFDTAAGCNWLVPHGSPEHCAGPAASTAPSPISPTPKTSCSGAASSWPNAA